jgi:hypothetical protein
MTLSSRRKRQTTARTIRPLTGLIDSDRFTVNRFISAGHQPILARLGNWFSSALLLTVLPIFFALPLSSAVAQGPQATAAQNATAQNATAPATWMPPVHVAPQRVEVAPLASAAIKLSDQYPGVFDPEPTPTRSAPSEAYPNERLAAPARTSRRQNSAAAMRGQGSAPARGNFVGPRLRNGGPAAAVNHSAQSNQPGNRQVNYQQPFDQSLQPADTSPQSEVQPAFVADGYQLPPNAAPQRTASRARSGRGEFTGTRAPAVRDAGLNAEYAELEQPLSNFAQTPADQPGGAAQAESRDASVLDNGPALPSWQSSDLSRGVPARPASMPRNMAPAESAELPGEPIAGQWNPNMPPPAGVINSPESIPDSIDLEPLQDIDTLPRPQKTLSCDELRKKLLSEPLTDIALDVSPQLPERGELPTKPSGDWVDHNGKLLARGQMVALSRGYVIVDTAEGRRKISLARLGDASLAIVASAWQLPGECAIGQGEFAGRCWTPQLSTWYASNLCHKPLYFENVQLERYGHSAGPIMGPIRTSAHFFGSLAFWPYHTAINPPNECIYALGHYRPGNCAPWLVDPFPFSARGAIRQGAVVTGAAFLF